MGVFDNKTLRRRGREALARARYSPKKLVALHTGAMLAVSLVLTLLNYYLNHSINNTGGLEDLGTRSVLQTAQMLLMLGYYVLLPFWQIGLISAMLKLIRGESPEAGSLFGGFRHWGPVLRMNLLQGVIAFLVIMLASQVGSTIYMMTPAAKPVLDLTEQLLQSGTMDPSALITEEVAMAILKGYIPILLITTAVIGIPVYYRLWMMNYVLMDMPQRGAFFALRMSLFMTRKNAMKLFKLDLSFWWFYLLQLLAAVAVYGDVILRMAGIQLGLSEALTGIVFSIVGMLGQLALFVWKYDYVAATYAAAYEALLPPPPEET